MQTATVTVEYVNPPKAGKRMGSIKTKELGYIGVWPNQLDQFAKGQSYTIQYETQGDFKKFAGMAGSMAAKPNQSAAPSPRNGSKSVGEEASMFAMGLLNRLYAGTGTFPGFEVLRDQIVQARGAWLNAMGQTRGPEVKPPEPPPFDDDIPL